MRLRGIHQIEITNRCNLACQYCINRKMTRSRVDISHEVFSRALDWYEMLRDAQDYPRQDELALTGCGEPFLHPLMPDFIAMARDRFPSLRISISTNGLALTPDMVDAIAPYRPDIYLSLHVDISALEPVRAALAKHGLLRALNDQYTWRSFNWAGQVDWPVTAQAMPCMYLHSGYACILSDGQIVNCCLDGDGLAPIGDIMTSQPEDIEVRPSALCGKCHLVAPGAEVAR